MVLDHPGGFKRELDDYTILLAGSLVGYVAFLAASIVEVAQRPNAFAITALVGSGLLLLTPLVVLPIEFDKNNSSVPLFRLHAESNSFIVYATLLVVFYITFVIGASAEASPVLRNDLIKVAVGMISFLFVGGLVGMSIYAQMKGGFLLLVIVSPFFLILGITGTATLFIADDYIDPKSD